MNSKFIKVVLLFIFVCIANNSSSDDINYLLVKTVDKDNHPIKAEIVKWWLSGSSEKKKALICKRDTCSEWIIRDKLTQAVSVYAFASREKKNDPNCWDWFEGESEYQVDQKQIVLTLLYTTTVCK